MSYWVPHLNALEPPSIYRPVTLLSHFMAVLPFMKLLSRIAPALVDLIFVLSFTPYLVPSGGDLCPFLFLFCCPPDQSFAQARSEQPQLQSQRRTITDLPLEVLVIICDHFIPAEIKHGGIPDYVTSDQSPWLHPLDFYRYGLTEVDQVQATHGGVKAHKGPCSPDLATGEIPPVTGPTSQKQSSGFSSFASFAASCRHFHRAAALAVASRNFTMTISDFGITFENHRFTFPCPQQGPWWRKSKADLMVGNVPFERFVLSLPRISKLQILVFAEVTMHLHVRMRDYMLMLSKNMKRRARKNDSPELPAISIYFRPRVNAYMSEIQCSSCSEYWDSANRLSFAFNCALAANHRKPTPFAEFHATTICANIGSAIASILRLPNDVRRYSFLDRQWRPDKFPSALLALIDRTGVWLGLKPASHEIPDVDFWAVSDPILYPDEHRASFLQLNNELGGYPWGEWADFVQSLDDKTHELSHPSPFRRGWLAYSLQREVRNWRKRTSKQMQR